MKQSTLFKWLSLVVILVMLAACTPKAATEAPVEEPVEEAQPAEVVAEAEPTEAAVEEEPAPAAEPFKVTWYQGCPWVADPLPDSKDDFVHQYILANYNIDLSITFNAECDDAKTTAMIAAGDVPDFMQQYWTTGTPTLIQLIDQGIILPIDLEKYSGMKNAIPADGWNFLKRDDQVWGFTPPGDPTHQTLWIRQDWLDKLGLKTPTTPDEVLEVAKAFTYNDPDGNGDNDTYGMTSFASSGNPYAGLWAFLAPFGFQPNMTDLMIKDNQVYFPGLGEGAKEGLMWLNKVVAEGVLDPAWSTNTEDQFRQLVATNKVGMVTYYHYMLNPNYYEIADSIEQSGSPANWVWMDPLTGPAGKYMVVQTIANGIGNAFFVTIQAQSEPGKYEAVMKMLNDAIDVKSDLYRIMVWGEKDVTYWTDEQGNIVKRQLDDAHKYMGHYRLFRTGNLEYRQGSWGLSHPPAMVEGFTRADNLPVLWSVRGLVAAGEGQADLDTYVSEMHINFVTDEESFDNWDAFVEEAMTTYGGQQLLDDAAAQLKTLGLIQ